MILNKIKHMKKEKQKELLMYLVFGITTTLVNIFVFQGLLLFEMDYKIANLFAVIIGKLYAYVTNKKFVFRSKCNSFLDAFKEFIRFVYARGITGLIDYFGLIIAVEYINLDPTWAKYILQLAIIIINYILSKVLVFRHDKVDEPST